MCNINTDGCIINDSLCISDAIRYIRVILIYLCF